MPSGVELGGDWVSSRTGRPVTAEDLADADEDLEGAIAEACGDGPIPPELTILFGEGWVDPDDRDPNRIFQETEHGVYPGGVVVIPLGLVVLDAQTRDADLGQRGIGRLEEAALREEWCEATRAIARTPLFLPRTCDWEASTYHGSLRVRWGERALMRRGSILDCAPINALNLANRRFYGRVVGVAHLLQELIDLREHVNEVCTVPTLDFEVLVVVDRDGRARVESWRDVPPPLRRCIRRHVRALPRSDELVAYEAKRGFLLERLELLYLWEGGHPHRFFRGR